MPSFNRAPRDYSQRLRRSVQLAFLALNVWIGIQFVRFVHYYESGGNSLRVSRPPGIEGWLPIASLMNLKVLLRRVLFRACMRPGLFLLIAFVAISWLLRKAFCGWLCPVGTISEYLWRIGRDAFKKNWKLPRPLDISLRSLKYLLLGLFVYAIAGMSVAAIRAFLEGPYGLIADVKLLNFFRYLGVGGAITLAAIVVLSVFIQNFWCRYLCPYGALVGLFRTRQPVAHSPQRHALHRLRQMHSRVPGPAAGRSTGEHQVGRVHGLPAMCSLLPGIGGAGDVRRHAASHTRVGHRRRYRRHLLRSLRIRPRHRPLAHRFTRSGVHGTGTPRARIQPPLSYAVMAVRVGWYVQRGSSAR